MVITITQVGAVPEDLTKLVHRRKIVTFANDSGTVDVFTITGRVRIEHLTAFCTTDLTETGNVTNLELGGATDPNALIVSISPDALDTGEFWFDGTPTSGPVQEGALTVDAMTDEDIILTITGGTDIATGVIVFDIWYVPITDGAVLVAA